jgi:hypothetical protein
MRLCEMREPVETRSPRLGFGRAGMYPYNMDHKSMCVFILPREGCFYGMSILFVHTRSRSGTPASLPDFIFSRAVRASASVVVFVFVVFVVVVVCLRSFVSFAGLVCGTGERERERERNPRVGRVNFQGSGARVKVARAHDAGVEPRR